MTVAHMLAAVAVSKLVAFCAAAAATGGALVGLIFRGAAAAWREEKEAAVSKAERLDKKVDEQAAQILTLQGKVEVLERRTNYDEYAKRSGREHAQIIEGLAALTRGLHANTTAVEFLVKQAFPDAAATFSTSEGA